jgi:hypothetical protein
MYTSDKRGLETGGAGFPDGESDVHEEERL